MRTESEFLVDILARLNQAAVDYMLTGSMASNFWGIPRTTHDLDFVVVIEPGKVEQFVSLFREGMFIQEESVRSASQPPFQFNVLDELSALKADFWMLREDEFERTAFGRRVGVELFGVSAWVATPEDVLLHKLYWHSLTPSQRQLLDAAGVYAVQADALDRAYIDHWVGKLKVEPAWLDIASGRIAPKST